MFRKLALVFGAIMALGFGVASAPAPAAAQVGFGIHVGPGYGYGYGPPRRYYRDEYRPRRYYAPPPRRHCERVVVRKRVYGEWRRVVERRCYPRRYRY
ncbi:hypothetical protein [Terrihabitans rhizophilus]|jgi:hypothetical protein|uniref:PXPV repeat-containing protein n=1 Tax=Terrihabitans rhizophilus TaxID=3092662 RepID=A0ABU4RTE9_9HYPH|nr:hypothetical protein [Terrihabitans sp. PJ23]MDX6807354.1 hypothetical protein [Terrihabitans sp. PJ23]